MPRHRQPPRTRQRVDRCRAGMWWLQRDCRRRERTPASRRFHGRRRRRKAAAVKPVLRGRGDEMSRVLSLLRRVEQTGQGAAVFVRGEPGIGKTALLDAVSEQASRLGFRVGLGKAEEQNQIAPMAPLLAALRFGSRPLLSAEAFADLAPLYRQQLWLVDRLASVLEEHAMRSPLLIAVDDVQWADRLTVFALRTLPVRLADVPVVWMLSSRPDPAGMADEVHAVVRTDIPVEVMDLQPLASSDVELIARDRLGAPPGERLVRLLQGANGVPYLAVELIDAMLVEAGRADDDAATGGEELPGPFVTGLRGRLHRLPEEVRRVLAVGAVLGRSFRIDDAAALLDGISTEDVIRLLEQAMRADVLGTDRDRIVFRHDLVRQAVYADVPHPMRTILHRAAAELLLTTGDDPVAAAPHLLVSAVKNDRRAIDILHRAAKALRTLAPVTASDLIVAALALLPRWDNLSLRLGEEAIGILGEAHRTREAMALGDDLLENNFSNEDTARIQGRLAWLLWGLGRPDEMSARLESALALNGLSAGTRRHLLSLHALALSRGTDMIRAEQVSTRALEEAGRSGDRSAEALALRALADIALTEGRVSTALEQFSLLRSTGRSLDVGEIMTLLLVDEYDSASRLILLSRRSADDTGISYQIPGLLFAQAVLDFRNGRLDEASTGFAALTALGDGPPHAFQKAAKVVMARIALHRGDLQIGRELCGAVSWDATGEPPEPRQVIMWGRVLIAEGKPDEAVRLLLHHRVLDDFRIGFRWTEQPIGIPDWIVEFTDAAAASGHHDVAVRMARLLRCYAERNPNSHLISGLADQAEGLATDDVALLRRGLEGIKHSRRGLLEAGAWEKLGYALLRRGGKAEATQLLETAGDAFQNLGALGDARRVQHAMQAAGLRRRRRTSAVERPLSGWEALTDTEQRVARLVGEGHSNRSAAGELMLSPNTIAAHLRTIFRKLEVNSRVQLANKLRDEKRSAG
ncbi:helix-turn-helix transcriptional regulator [Actinacidiphila guanduensis]|nr:AAA family ATPase [Actinacidiphila guanduensis]